MLRDRQGFEVDFVLTEGDNKLLLIEVKATKTPKPTDGRAVAALAQTIRKQYNREVEAIVVHADTKRYLDPMPLRPGVKAISWIGLANFLARRQLPALPPTSNG